ncbi:hypothetical protein U1Q18_021842, partial [Sarracenia purpurea var. burkii]
ISKEENGETDQLAQAASSDQECAKRGVIKYQIDLPGIEQQLNDKDVMLIDEMSWTTPLISYLQDSELPPDQNEAWRLKFKVT